MWDAGGLFSLLRVSGNGGCCMTSNTCHEKGRGAQIIHFILTIRRAWSNADIIHNLISVPGFLKVHVSRGLFTHSMLGAGQTTAGLNHFPLSQTGEPVRIQAALLSQLQIDHWYYMEERWGGGGFIGSPQPCLLDSHT